VTGASFRLGRIQVITDTVVQDRFDHVQLAQLAIRGGAGSIQLRDKNLGDKKFLDVAREILDVCRQAKVPLVINDRLDAAAEIGADGLHLGQDDAAIEEARRVLGPEAIIGGSAGTMDQVVQVANAGADYVGFGHVFETRSKSKPAPPVGLEALRRVCVASKIPVFAIGGISADNAGDVRGAGAWGIAVIGAVCASEDPQTATRRLVEIFR
jgi:thiamine-phosphate pyrophosphorylase